MSKPPSHRYRDYDHPTEEQHRTAEQFNWRDTKTLNVCIAVAATFAAIFAMGSFYETRRQANISQETLISTERPWTEIVEFRVKLVHIDMNYMVVDTRIVFKNVGHSPALNVSIWPEISVVMPETGDLSGGLATVCDRAKRGTDLGELASAVIFPEQEVIADETLNFFVTTIGRLKGLLNAKSTDPRIHLNVCVTYKGAGSDTLRHTSFGVVIAPPGCSPDMRGCAFDLDRVGNIDGSLIEQRQAPVGRTAD